MSSPDPPHRKLVTTLSVAASLIAIIGFIFGITRLYGDERPFFPPHPSSSSLPAVTTPSPPFVITRESYIEAAEQVCYRYTEWFGRIDSTTDVEERLTLNIRVLDSLIIDLRTIKPPPADQAIVGRIIDDMRDASNILRDALAYYYANDIGGLKRTEEALNQKAGEAQERARNYGLRVCAE